MTKIKFSQEEKEQMAAKVKRYFDTEMKQDIGSFEAEFLIDFFAEEIGGYFYNRGLYDAQVIVSGKVEEIADALAEIEKPAPSGGM
jgi:uncharacterized protein (DUF2164 family)